MSNDAARAAGTLGAVAKSDDDGALGARSREQDKHSAEGGTRTLTPEGTGT
jgi:hypothetical protein